MSMDNPDSHLRSPTSAPDEISAGHIDPVCGMTVLPERSAATVEHNGQTYYFCCRSCEQKFRKDPERYLAPRPAELVQINLGLRASVAAPKSTSCCSGGDTTSPNSAPVDAAPRPGMKVEYICPMDLEVLAEIPGACPIC